MVSVEFLPVDGGTEIVIRHDRLSEETAALHRDGWNACLDKLERGVPSR